MSKRKKEAEVIVFEEPKFKKRKSEKEMCRVSVNPAVCIHSIETTWSGCRCDAVVLMQAAEWRRHQQETTEPAD